MRRATIFFLMTIGFGLIAASQANAGIVGIDVSRWQGTIDWEITRNYVSFAMIKAGGSDEGFYVDGQFDRNRKETQRLGISRGFYYYAGGGDPIQEAEHLAAIVGKLQPGELVALDYEIDHPNPVVYALEFMNRTEQLLGAKPLLYTNMNRAWGIDWRGVVDNGNPLWGAIFDGDPNTLPSPGVWPAVTIKQFSNGGTVPGIGTYTDVNIFNFSTQEFEAMGRRTMPRPDYMNSAEPKPETTPSITPDDASAASTQYTVEENNSEVPPLPLTAFAADKSDVKEQATNIDAAAGDKEVSIEIKDTGQDTPAPETGRPQTLSDAGRETVRKAAAFEKMMLGPFMGKLFAMVK